MGKQKNKYFHDTYFKKIIKMSEENRLEESLVEFRKYISTYPNDLGGYIYYADALMKLGEFSKAEEILKNVPVLKGTSQASKDELLMFKIKLLCCQDKYNEALKILKQNIELFRKNDWSFFGTLLFIKKKLNILEPVDYKNAETKYLWSQIISYDSEKALEHINRHMSFEGNDNTATFNEDFPLRDVYFKLRELLPTDGRIYSDMINNFYIFRYDSNGHIDSKLVDYIYVVTLKDSNDIITMYPYENRERRDCIDLTPKFIESPKVKRMSQIDKFNQRYGKKVDNN